MIKFNFFRFLACSFLVAGNLLCFVNLTWANPPQIRPTQQQKLRPMPEDSYQLARSVFLPNADDDIWYSEYDKIPGISTGESASNKCTESGYNLLSCPINGKCSPCPSDAAYKKLTSCAEGYKISASKKYCEKFCAANYCDKSSPSGYFMTSCPEGMNCGEPCVEISTNCNQMNYYKVTTECISGYHYEGGRCVKNCEEISCGAGSGTSRTWKDECPTGYLCTEIANYMTTDCKTGRCYQYKACDEANGYFKPTGSSPGTCENKPCYNSTNSCSAYPLSVCPANGICSECKVKYADCSTGDTKYKLDGCADGYEISGNSCVSQCLNYRLDKCPTNASCTSCNIVNNDGSVAAQKYSFVNCSDGYVNEGTTSSPNCKRVGSCKEYLIATNPVIQGNKILVSNQEELEQALNDIGLTKYEGYNIVITDDFTANGSIENTQPTDVKGILETIPTEVAGEICKKPTIKVEKLYTRNINFEGIDFDVSDYVDYQKNNGPLAVKLYGPDTTFKKCNIYGNTSSLYYAGTHEISFFVKPQVAWYGSGSFEDGVIRGTIVALSGTPQTSDPNYTHIGKFNFNLTENFKENLIDESVIIPLGTGRLEITSNAPLNIGGSGGLYGNSTSYYGYTEDDLRKYYWYPGSLTVALYGNWTVDGYISITTTNNMDTFKSPTICYPINFEVNASIKGKGTSSFINTSNYYCRYKYPDSQSGELTPQIILNSGGTIDLTCESSICEVADSNFNFINKGGTLLLKGK